MAAAMGEARMMKRSVLETGDNLGQCTACEIGVGGGKGGVHGSAAGPLFSASVFTHLELRSAVKRYRCKCRKTAQDATFAPIHAQIYTRARSAPGQSSA